MRRTLILLAAVAAGLLALAWQQGWLGAGGGRLNVLLVSIDSLRQDRLGVYGHRPELAPGQRVSPAMDALAADGVAFEEAWSNTSWTLPAHAALLTGLSDRAHGVVMDDFALDPRRRTLARHFQAAGYATAGIYSGPYLDPKFGFGRGFGRYESAMLPPEEFAARVAELNRQREAEGQPALTPREVSQLQAQQADRDVTSPRVNRGALRFLEGTRGKPWFLFLHYFDVHYDYLPPAHLARNFDPEYRGDLDGENWFRNPRVRDPRTGQRRISERDLAHVRALYDAEIRWVDQHLEALFQYLRDQGLWDRTIVVVLADHGDEFFEHGGVGHRSTLHAELVKIPLILRVPGEAEDGRRVRGLARIYDVAPTLADFAGLPPMPEAEGRSLRGVLDGTAPPATVLHRIAWYGQAAASNVRDGWRDGRYSVLRKHALGGGGPESLLTLRPGEPPSFLKVFDRREDPGEHRPLPEGDPRRGEALAAFCRDFRAGEAFARSLPASPLEERYATAPSAQERAALVELGYAVAGEAREGDRLPVLEPLPEPCPD